MKLRKHTIALAAAACTLLNPNAAQAAVTVTFEQVGPNVVATWAGSLNPGTFLGDGIFAVQRLDSNVRHLYVNDIGTGDVWTGGTAEDRGPFGGVMTSYTSGAPGGGSFGFDNTDFYFGGLDNDIADQTVITFDGGAYTMVWANKTLISLGADSFNNTLAWTSAAGGTNTISYTTVPVPEPSAALLAACGALGLLRRRR